jgi:phage baseplate assembly protein W
MTNSTITGTGIAYPVTFSSNNKTQLLELVSGSEAIHQSLYIILNTNIGDRYNNPKFGSNLKSLVFEQNTNLLKDLLYFNSVEAIAKWEPRVTLTKVGFIIYTDDPHIIGIRLQYIENETHTPGSYVYPFVRGGESLESLLGK